MASAQIDDMAISAETRARLREAQLHAVNSQIWLAAISTPALSILVSVVLWPLIAHANIVIWLGSVFILSAARMFGYFRFIKLSPSGEALEFWHRYITVTTTASAWIWGMALIFLWPAGHPLQQLVLTMPLVGSAAGATAAYAPIRKIYLLFITGIMIPLIGRYLLEGTLEHTTVGFMGILYLGILMGIGRNLHGSGDAALLTGFQKGELAESLESKNAALEEAMHSVKTLSGMLPICANCKKIRDDQGYYQQIEHYITEHSEAEFTHGICPDCAKELYPDIHLSDG